MIQINRTPNADSRTMESAPTLEKLAKATDDHIAHVQLAMIYFAEGLMNRAGTHDFTKRAYMEEFHEALTTLAPGDEFKAGPWYQMHITRERHHLLSHVPNDIDLIDVFEYICDCVMAGLSRAGEVTPLQLPPEMLEQAFQNTVQMLTDEVVIEEETDV